MATRNIHAKTTHNPSLPGHLYDALAEANVIAAIIKNPKNWDEVADIISEQDFIVDDYRKIYIAIKQQIAEKKEPDPFTTGELLERRYGFINAEEFLMGLVLETTGLNPKSYALSIKAASIDRQLHQAAAQIQALIVSKDDHRLEQAQKLIMSIDNLRISAPEHVKETLAQVLDDMDARFTRGGELNGLSTGYIDLDKRTYGLQASDLIILAGRPGMGKTTLAMNIAENVAITQKQPVLVFSLEMSKKQLVERMLASRGRIDHEIIKLAKMSDDVYAKLGAAIAQLSESSLIVDDAPSLSLLEMRSRALRVKRQYGLSLIVVDYLQLIHERAESETVKISQISAGLKALAKELNVPVIALSQLNRAVEQRHDKRPTMADLRQSGSIEQDADLILMVYRDEVYDANTEAKGLAEVNIVKHRHGETGCIYLTFAGRYYRFDNYSGGAVVYKSAERELKMEGIW
jgi:replicative DNA helicase